MVNGKWWSKASGSGDNHSRRTMCNYHSLFTIDHLPLEQINLVHEYRLAVAVERDDEAEADGCLGRRDHDDEDREDLARDRVRAPRLLQVPREGYEVQVRGVQYQLDGHEDDDDVAPREHARHAYREEQRADDEELRDVRVQHALLRVQEGLL